MRFEVPAGSVVVINYTRGMDRTDDEIRVAISIEIRGNHRVRQSVRFLELKAGPEIAFSVIEVNEAAESLRAGGDIGMTVAIEIGHGDGA